MIIIDLHWSMKSIQGLQSQEIMNSHSMDSLVNVDGVFTGDNFVDGRATLLFVAFLRHLDRELENHQSTLIPQNNSRIPFRSTRMDWILLSTSSQTHKPRRAVVEEGDCWWLPWNCGPADSSPVSSRLGHMTLLSQTEILRHAKSTVFPLACWPCGFLYRFLGTCIFLICNLYARISLFAIHFLGRFSRLCKNITMARINKPWYIFVPLFSLLSAMDLLKVDFFRQSVLYV